eukprot:TRINITY_DN1369_c0_g1_i1.p1 TRINITY_DN1369_c0_g1~~TRINITY_DN1369_c0_g1_i1.p1  ORF type:complete len:253 (+),score=26.05 TRINITY_DN1369_c0_g1_i1:1-759(+)
MKLNSVLFLIILILYCANTELITKNVQLSREDILEIECYAFVGNKNKLENTIMGEIVPISTDKRDMNTCIHQNKSVNVGKMVLVGNGNRCSTEKHIELAAKMGATIAVIVGNWETCNFKDQSASSFTNQIPTVCIESKQNQTINLINMLYNGNYTTNGLTIKLNVVKNPVQKMNKAGIIFYQVFFLGIFFIELIAIGLRLIAFIKADSEIFTFPKFEYIMIITGIKFNLHNYFNHFFFFFFSSNIHIWKLLY